MNPTPLYAKPQTKDLLQFPDAPPGPAAYITEDFGNCKLEARILYNEAHDAPWVLSIHGARADFTKSNPITFGLQKRDYSSLAMTLSGHSPAGILKPEETSLANNIIEAKTFYENLDGSRPKTLIAFSMGGAVALEVLAKHLEEIDRLVLFYPAIYAVEANKKRFGEEFRQVLTTPYSYRQNRSVDILKRFKGKLLLIKGQYDGLDPEAYGKPAGGSVGEFELDGKKHYSPIPKEVIDMIYEAVPADRRQFIEVAGCDHLMMGWLRQHPAEAEKLLDQIDTFIRSN